MGRLYLTRTPGPRKIVFRQAASAEVSAPIGDPEAWHHVVGTYDGKSIRLYHNGQEVAKRRLSAPPSINTYPVTIAGGATDADRSTDCTVRAAAIYNHAL